MDLMLLPLPFLKKKGSVDPHENDWGVIISLRLRGNHPFFLLLSVLRVWIAVP
jgi:hypothetical protein